MEPEGAALRRRPFCVFRARSRAHRARGRWRARAIRTATGVAASGSMIERHAGATTSSVNRSRQRRTAAAAISARRDGDLSSATTASVSAPCSPTGTTAPVSPSTMTVRTPGQSVETIGRPDSPASMSTPGVPSPAGRLGNTKMSLSRMIAGMSSRLPSISTPAAAARGARASASGPSPTTRACTSRPRARAASTMATNRSGPFCSLSAPTKSRVGAPAAGRRRRSPPAGWKTSGSRPLGTSTDAVRRDLEPVELLEPDLLALGGDDGRPARQRPPQPELGATRPGPA